MHAGQLKVDVATVRELVDLQFPQWRQLPVTAVPAQGTENALFWLGERMVIASIERTYSSGLRLITFEGDASSQHPVCRSPSQIVESGAEVDDVALVEE
jgi:hypothetical protein